MATAVGSTAGPISKIHRSLFELPEVVRLLSVNFKTKVPPAVAPKLTDAPWGAPRALDGSLWAPEIPPPNGVKEITWSAKEAIPSGNSTPPMRMAIEREL